MMIRLVRNLSQSTKYRKTFGYKNNKTGILKLVVLSQQKPSSNDYRKLTRNRGNNFYQKVFIITIISFFFFFSSIVVITWSKKFCLFWLICICNNIFFFLHVLITSACNLVTFRCFFLPTFLKSTVFACELFTTYRSLDNDAAKLMLDQFAPESTSTVAKIKKKKK